MSLRKFFSIALISSLLADPGLARGLQMPGAGSVALDASRQTAFQAQALELRPTTTRNPETRTAVLAVNRSFPTFNESVRKLGKDCAKTREGREKLFSLWDNQRPEDFPNQTRARLTAMAPELAKHAPEEPQTAQLLQIIASQLSKQGDDPRLHSVFAKVAPILGEHLDTPEILHTLSTFVSIAVDRPKDFSRFAGYLGSLFPGMIDASPVFDHFLESAFRLILNQVGLPPSLAQVENLLEKKLTAKVAIGLIGIIASFPSPKRLNLLFKYLQDLPIEQRAERHAPAVIAFSRDSREKRLTNYLKSLAPHAGSAAGQEAILSAIEAIVANFYSPYWIDKVPGKRAGDASRGLIDLLREVAPANLDVGRRLVASMIQSIEIFHINDEQTIDTILDFENLLPSDALSDRIDRLESLGVAIAKFGTGAQLNTLLTRLQTVKGQAKAIPTVEQALTKQSDQEKKDIYLRHFPERKYLGDGFLSQSDPGIPFWRRLEKSFDEDWIHVHFPEIDPRVPADIIDMIVSDSGQLNDINPSDWNATVTSAAAMLAAQSILDKTIPRMVMSIIKNFMKALGLRGKIITEVVDEPDIATSEIVRPLTPTSRSGGPSTGMMSMGLSIRQTLELKILLYISLDNLIRVDRVLLLKHRDRFLRALLFIVSHDFGHFLIHHKEGKHFNITIAPPTSSGKDIFGEEAVARNARETAIDKIGWSIASAIKVPSFKFPEDLPYKEHFYGSYLEAVEVLMDSARNGPVSEMDNNKMATLLARMEAGLRELQPANDPIKDRADQAVRLLADLRALFEKRWSGNPEALIAYEALVSDYRRIWRETGVTLNPKAPPTSRQSPRRRKNIEEAA